MEDHGQDPNSHHQDQRNHEPVRSRWTPKPEQILILESIFNSGMVNPPKDETVRIRKLLEKFGAVGDANVFYWFQNRRSRSRRRQRQMQATLAGAELRNTNGSNSNSHNHGASHGQFMSGAISQNIEGSSNSTGCGYAPLASASNYPHQCSSANYHMMGSSQSSSFYGGIDIGHEVGSDEFFSITGQMGYPKSDPSSIFCSSDASSLPYQSGYITVFINGVATEVPRGPIDMKAVFGENAMLVHSSGVPLPVNEFGFLMQILEHGESYFLVSRPA